MKLFLSCFRLIRPFNLIIIALTLYMVRFYFILPCFNFFNFTLQVKEPVFSLFVLSFASIAAAGYIINDYYDVNIDKVNKPGSIIIGNTLSAKSALTSYVVLNIVGLITGAWSCYKAGAPFLELLFVFYVIGLWLYSYKLKSTFFFGNMLIGLFLSLVPLASAYIEFHADYNNPESPDMTIDSLKSGVFAIAFFAFLLTLIREIVKDMEDMEGDHISGARTMPIVWGIKKVKRLVQLLLIIIIDLLGIIQYYAWNSGWHPTTYYMLLIQVPCLIIIWKIQKASGPKEFHTVSTWLKITMVAGICYLFVFAYEFNLMVQIFKKFMHPL